MKKGLKLFSLLLGSSILLSGCDQFTSDWPNQLPSPEEMGIDTPWSDYSNPCSSIAFGKGDANVNLNKGETHTYSYSVEPRDFDTSSLVWASDNPEVATIENGVLTAVGGGKTNITLSCGEVVARSLVTVTVPITEFNVLNKEISLDIEGTSQINYEFAPEDTTQSAVQYSTESDIITVSDSGLITALGVTGDAEVKVTNEGLNKVEIVNVHVSDNWNYISTMTLSGPSKLEVTKSSNLTCNAVGVDPSREASALSNNSVVYSVKEGSEEFISVDAETGAITGLEPGNATLVAKLVDDRHPEALSEEALEEKTFTSEFAVEVFEVSIVSLDLTDSETIELDNAENTSHQLSYTFTLSDPSFEEASRANIAYTSSDLEVATVSESGLVETVGPGTATITVKDLTSNVSDSIDVHTTIYAKSITLNSSGDFYLDESIEISANVVPAKTTESVVWDYDEASGHTFVEQDNKLIVTCNNLDSSVDVKASVGGVTSNTLTLTPKEREVAFESGKTYIVGSSNFKTGVSKDVEGGSWNAAKYAFVMTDKTGNAHAKYEYKATIEFRENDLWKIRENVEDWRNLESTNGHYKLNEGAFATGQMVRESADESANVLVKEAGKYDVYYAYYDDTETGWYEVYVEEHGMKLSATSVHAKLTSPATISTITASNYDGTLAVSDVDEEFITVLVDQTTGKISITPIKEGVTAFKVVDDVKEIIVSVEIKEGSIAETTEYYIRGTAIGTWDINADYVLRASKDDNNLGEILDVYLNLGEFKIANSDYSKQWGYKYKNDDEAEAHVTVIGSAAKKFSEADSDGNIKCNAAGYYNIYLTKNNYIAIESEGGDEPVELSSYYLRGDAVGSWDVTPENQMSLDDSNKAVMLGIEMSVGEFKIGNADWSTSWGYKYKNEGEEVEHVTIIGGAKDNFSAGNVEDNNIKCDVAGRYNIYLTNNNYISIELDEFNLSATSATIEAGESFVVTAHHLTGVLDYLVTSGTADVVIDGNKATITSSTVGTAEILFADDSEDPGIDFTLTVVEPGTLLEGYYASINGTPTFKLEENDKGEYIIAVAKLNEDDQISIYNAETKITFHASLETSFTSSFEDGKDYITCKSTGYYLLCLKLSEGNDVLYIGKPIVTYTGYYALINNTDKINLVKGEDDPNYKENYSASLELHALKPNDRVDFYGVFEYGGADAAIALKSNIYPNTDDTEHKIENNLKPVTKDGVDFTVQCNTTGTLYFNVNKDDTFGFWLTDGPTIMEGYWLQVNGVNVANFAYDKKEGNFEQYFASVEVEAGQTIQIYNAGDKTTFAVKFNSSSQGFTESGGTITCTKSGTYDFYLKLLYGQDEIYIGEHIERKNCTVTFTLPDWSPSVLTELKLHCWADGMGEKDIYATMKGNVGTFNVSIPKSISRLNVCVCFKQDGNEKWSINGFIDVTDGGSYTITGRFDQPWQDEHFVISIA